LNPLKLVKLTWWLADRANARATNNVLDEVEATLKIIRVTKDSAQTSALSQSAIEYLHQIDALRRLIDGFIAK
jgi:hypothetical protein